MRRLIGYWVSERTPDWPDPATFIDPEWNASERAAVVAFLRAGTPINAAGGLSWCRICLCHLGDSEWADVAYEWPNKLEHYVEAHSVRLPQEFVDHVLSGATGPPVGPAYPFGPRDTDWWRSQSGSRSGRCYRREDAVSQLWLDPAGRRPTSEQIQNLREHQRSRSAPISGSLAFLGRDDGFRNLPIAEAIERTRGEAPLLLFEGQGHHVLDLAARARAQGLRVIVGPEEEIRFE